MMEKLTRKLGPLPVWAWGVILGVVILGVILWQRSIAGAAGAGDTTTTGETLPDVSGDPLQPAPTGGGSNTPDGISLWGSNALWLSAALTMLAGSGVSPLEAQVALENYLKGVKLTPKQQAIVNAVLSRMGLPPEGTEGTQIVTDPTPPVITVPKPPVKPPIKGQPVKPHPPIKRPVPKSHKYTVKKGDTISEISLHFYGKSTPALWDKIARANHITNRNLIHPGQVLTIPA